MGSSINNLLARFQQNGQALTGGQMPSNGVPETAAPVEQPAVQIIEQNAAPVQLPPSPQPKHQNWQQLTWTPSIARRHNSKELLKWHHNLLSNNNNQCSNSHSNHSHTTHNSFTNHNRCMANSPRDSLHQHHKWHHPVINRPVMV